MILLKTPLVPKSYDLKIPVGNSPTAAHLAGASGPREGQEAWGRGRGQPARASPRAAPHARGTHTSVFSLQFISQYEPAHCGVNKKTATTGPQHLKSHHAFEIIFPIKNHFRKKKKEESNRFLRGCHLRNLGTSCLAAVGAPRPLRDSTGQAAGPGAAEAARPRLVAGRPPPRSELLMGVHWGQCSSPPGGQGQDASCKPWADSPQVVNAALPGRHGYLETASRLSSWGFTQTAESRHRGPWEGFWETLDGCSGT